MDITDTLYENLNEDVTELINFIHTHNKELAQELNYKLGSDDFIHLLEELILQLSRVYGVCAFEQDNDLKIFKERIEKVLNKDIIFYKIVNIYIENVDLININPDIKKKDFQTQRLKVFLNSIGS
jgi:hypothetical protein